MGIFSVLTAFIVGGAVLFGALSRYNMYEYSQFKVEPQDGKVILITGANSGLGLETARVLAKAGATVIMACRNKGRCSDAKSGIVKENPSAHVDTLLLDLGSFDSIRAAAAEFRSKYDHLDVLINNAGIMMLPTREVTTDGLEAQIGTNHFGHFLLTSLLLPSIAHNGRIINHSSGAHMFHKTGFALNHDDLHQTNYDPIVAYGNSKAANLLFTYELNFRFQARQDERNITSVAVHPGYTATNLQKERFPFWETMNAIFAMNVEQGALSQIHAAVDNNVKPSFHNFYGPKFAMFGAPAETSTSSGLWDHEASRALWIESVRVTGEDFQGL